MLLFKRSFFAFFILQFLFLFCSAQAWAVEQRWVIVHNDEGMLVTEGVSPDVYYTNDNNPTISVQCSIGEHLRISLNKGSDDYDSPAGNCQGNRAYKVQLGHDLSDGDYNFYAEIENSPGTFEPEKPSYLTISVDTVPPQLIVSGVAAEDQPVNAPFSVRVSLSEPATNFQDFTLTKEEVTLVGDAEITHFIHCSSETQNSECASLGDNSDYYIITIDPKGGDKVTIGVKEAGIVDAAGNGSTVTDSVTVLVDVDEPTITAASITSNNANPQTAVLGDSVTLTFTVGEIIDELPAVTIGGKTVILTKNDDYNYSASITIDESIADGELGFTVTATDDAGNIGPEKTTTTDGSAVLIDNKAPVITAGTLTSSNANASFAKEGDTLTLAFTLDAMIAGTPLVTIAGQPANVSTVDGQNFTADITVPANVQQGDIAYTINASDDAGNTAPELGGSFTNVQLDTQAPSVTITMPAYTPTGTFEVVFTLSEDSSDFTQDDIAVTGAASSLLGFTSESASLYRATINPGTDGNITVSVSAGTFTDLAGNANQATAHETIGADITDPEIQNVNISGPDPDNNRVKAGDSVTLSFEVNEDITNNPTVTNPTVTIGGISATVTQLADGSYEATYSVPGDFDGTLDYTISVTDDAGNISETMTQNDSTDDPIVVDNTIPVIGADITISGDGNTGYVIEGDTLTLEFTLNEDVSDTPTVMIAGQGATLSSDDGQNFTATISVNSETRNPLSYTINVQDDAGNTATPVSGTIDDILVDHTPPTLTIAMPDYTPTGTFPVILNFSEPVQGFDISDINVDNTLAQIQTLTPNSENDQFTLTLLPRTSGTLNVSVGANSYQDRAGLSNAAESTGQVDVDISNPVPFLSSDAPSLINGSFIVTINTGETTNDFSLDALVLTNADATELEGSNTEYQVTITPRADGPVSIAVGSGKYRDSAGNFNSVSNDLNYTADLTSPKPVITALEGVQSQEFWVDIDTNEVSSDFSASEDITVSGGSITDFSGNAQNYRALVRADASGTVSLEIAVGAYHDAAGNSNQASNPWSIEVDVDIPSLNTVSIVSNNENRSIADEGDTVCVGLEFSEPLTIVPSITIAGVAATPGQNPAPYDYKACADVSAMNLNQEGTLSFEISGYKDAAGNEGPTVSQTTDASSVSLRIKPIAEITAPGGSNIQAPSFTVTFSEAVENVDAADFTTNMGIVNSVTQVNANQYQVLVSNIMQAGNVTLGFSATNDIEDTGGHSLANPSVTASYMLNEVIILSLDAIEGALGTTGERIIFSLTFSHDVVNVDKNDFVLSGDLNSTEIVTVSGSGKTWDISVEGMSGSGSVILGVSDDNDIKDTSGNEVRLGTTARVGIYDFVDQSVPTLISIVPNAQSGSLDEIVFTATFSESVTGVGIEDFALSSTTTIAPSISVNGDGATWQVTASGHAGSKSGVITLALHSSNTINDLAGNALAQSNLQGSYSYAGDDTAPTLVSIAAPAQSGSADEIVFTVTFSESVTGVGTEDFALSSTTTIAPSIYVSGSGATWHVTVSGHLGSGSIAKSGTITLALNTTSNIADSAGNALAQSNLQGSYNYAGDDTAPTLVSIAAPAEKGSDETITFTATFSESVTGVGTDDFSLTGGTKKAGSITSVTGSDTSWQIVVAGYEGSGTLTLALASSPTITDIAGNALTPSSLQASYAYVDSKIAALHQSTALTGAQTSNSVLNDISVHTFTQRIQRRFAENDGKTTRPQGFFDKHGWTSFSTDMARDYLAHAYTQELQRKLGYLDGSGLSMNQSEQMLPKPASGEFGLYSALSFGTFKNKGDGAYDGDGLRFTVGADYLFGDSLVIGAAGSYEESTLDFKDDANGKIKREGNRLEVYQGLRLSDYAMIDNIITFGGYENKVVAGDESGTSDSNLFGLSTRLRGDFDLDYVELQPYGQINFMSENFDSYTTSDNTPIGAFDVKTTKGTLGFDLRAKRGALGPVQPYGGLALSWDMSETNAIQLPNGETFERDRGSASAHLGTNISIYDMSWFDQITGNIEYFNEGLMNDQSSSQIRFGVSIRF